MGDDQLNPYLLTQAYRDAAQNNGVRVLAGVETTGLCLAGSRVTGVRTAQGTFACDLAINAAGAWAAEVGRMAGVEIPVFPIKGQIVLSERLPPSELAPYALSRFQTPAHAGFDYRKVNN